MSSSKQNGSATPFHLGQRAISENGIRGQHRPQRVQKRHQVVGQRLDSGICSSLSSVVRGDLSVWGCGWV